MTAKPKNRRKMGQGVVTSFHLTQLGNKRVNEVAKELGIRRSELAENAINFYCDHLAREDAGK